MLLNDRQQMDLRGVATSPPGGVDATRVPAIPVVDAQRLIQPFLGKPIDGALLLAFRKDLQDYFISIHQPFVSVIIPPQIVDSGVVQVIVLVGRLGKVTVAGNEWFDAGQYTGALHVQPGGPIDGAQLDSDLDWINRNQYRHAAVVAQPGQQVGTTDLQVRTQERLPVSASFGVDNTGTQATNLYRLSSGVDWGNAFWRGDDLSANFTMSPDAYLVREYSLGYVAMLPWHDTLSLSGSISTSHPPEGSIVGSQGMTDNVSLRYQAELPAPSWLTHHLVLGYDFKSTNNNLLFGGSSIFNTTSEIDQFVVGYGGVVPDAWGTTSFDLALFVSPGGITPNNTNAAFSAQQAGATANYVYGHIVAERLTRLPAGFTWDVRGTAQVSDATLLPSEQLIFGGYASVRGFVEQGATRDNGVLLENELRLPPIQTGLPKLLGAKSVDDQLVPFVFFDLGAGWNHQEFDGVASWVELSSIGPGVTWQVERYLSLRFTWGIPLQRYGTVGPLLGPQFGLQLSL